MMIFGFSSFRASDISIWGVKAGHIYMSSGLFLLRFQSLAWEGCSEG